MKTIIVSLSAKSIHKSLAPWCLKSYCENNGEGGIEIIEASINNSVDGLIGRIYDANADVIAFSCYIWNIESVRKIGGIIKKLLPDTIIILGGPEVSFEENTDGFPFADYIIRGAGEAAFCALLHSLRDGICTGDKILDGCNRGFEGYPTPYTRDYFDSFAKNQFSIANQLVYFEASRGCSFACGYCLSSASDGVFYREITAVCHDLMLLVQSGAKCIKFVDRTFNADRNRAAAILEFILTLDTDCVFHFEAAADLFDERLLSLIAKMPPHRIQFEIGIQSVNEQALTAVGRKTDINHATANIARLLAVGNCHVHLDLIAGLPHETLETFKRGIDRCIRLKPHMLQLGFLKMLKGARLRREHSSFDAVFADFPPYEVYRTATLDGKDIIQLKKTEAVIDKFYNSGAFGASIDYALNLFDSPYEFFRGLSHCLPDDLDIKMSPKYFYELMLEFLSKHGDVARAADCVKFDCLSTGCKAVLPDGIVPMRNKRAEEQYRTSIKKSANIRIEFFETENKYRLFDYDSKNLLKNKFNSMEWILPPKLR